MGRVILNAAVSLDGFIADLDDNPGPLFDFYQNGEVPVTLGDEQRVFHTTPATAAHLREVRERTGASVVGRRLFDITDGWKGRPPAGEFVVVVTHELPTHWPYPDAPFEFETHGIEAAITRAKNLAGHRDVSVTGGGLAAQALNAGLVDEIHVELVPVLLGQGIRFIGELAGQHLLENPRIVAGDRVTHLIYDVRKG